MYQVKDAASIKLILQVIPRSAFIWVQVTNLKSSTTNVLWLTLSCLSLR